VPALILAGLIGLAAGRVLLALLICVAVLLAFQLRNLYWLDRWLRRRRTAPPPDIEGPWGDVVTTIHRIYRRKQLHKQRVIRLLREFRRFTSAMPDGAILLGPNHEILWFNRAAGRWLGLRRKLDFGIRVENLIRHPDFVRYMRQQERVEAVVLRDVGSGERWLSFHLVTTNAAAQQLLLVRDVSREAHIEEVRKDFVANASHELRSPLTVLAGYLDALADEP